MSAKFTLSPLSLLCLVCFLFIGELVSGTDFYFASMAALAVLCACITYNLLGGLGSISGIAFTSFALNTLVISQVGKVLSLEPADKKLLVPQLTITVYAVYYFSLMVGTFLYAWVRLPLPRPVEQVTPAQSRYLYAASLVGGVVGTISFTVLNASGAAAQESFAHGVSRALALLLPFALVLAVDGRIRSSGGRHCFGWAALWPTLVLMFVGFIGAGRSEFVEPLLIVLITGYLRGYHFRRRHYVGAIASIVVFFVFVSPFFLYSRGWRGAITIKEQTAVMVRILESAPAQWQTIKNTVKVGMTENDRTVSYFSGGVTLNRLALIGPDSTLINACSHGFHYGFTALRLDFLAGVPRVLYKNKPDIGSNEYLGHLDGQEGDQFVTTNSTITPVGDSYGAFSWLGVVLFPLLVVPAIFVIYESMFDMSRPWGTVATVSLLFGLVGGSMGELIVGTMIREPIYILVISWGAAWCLRMIPMSGDRPSGLYRSNASSTVDLAEDQALGSSS